MCRLHKAINLCKATIKGLSFKEQAELLRTIDVRQPDDDDETEEDLSLDGDGGVSRPKDAGKGHLAVWAVFKCLCTLHTKDDYRRGEGYNLLIENAKLPEFQWMRLKGNREAAWLFDAMSCARFVLDPQCGAAFCDHCRHRATQIEHHLPGCDESCTMGEGLRWMVPERGVRCAEAAEFYPAINTQDRCVICYLLDQKQKKPNRLEKVVSEYFCTPTVVSEWLVMRFVHEQIVEPIVRITASRAAMDCINLARQLEAGLLLFEADPLVYMRGEKRILDDWVIGTWNISGRGDKAQHAREVFYSQDLLSTCTDILRNLHAHPHASAAQIIVATVHQRQCAELPQCAEPGDIEQRSEFLRMVVEFMLVDDAANMPAYWENAVQVAQVAQSDLVQYAAKFEHDVNGAFELELQLHCTCRTNHVLGISRGMVDLVRACCATVATELLIMHRRQSKDLLSWRPSMSERRMYHFVLATNAELESLLGTVDHETREKRTQSTYATGALSSFSCCILGSIPRRMPVYRSCCCCLSSLPCVPLACPAV
jgi:hypothetical protein